MGRLQLKPTTLKQANAMVADLHRHHKPAVGHRFSISAYRDGELVGVVIVSRPVGRGWDHYNDCEVIRCCTDGTRNACSFLYGAADRIAKEMGFRQIITYTLESEGGASLRAAGWLCDGVVRRDGRGWSNRPGRKEEHPEPKVRWRKIFKPDEVS